MTQFQITWDCSNPSRMTRFWSQALGYSLPCGPGREGATELIAQGATRLRVHEQEGLDH